jgi:hypothetical protein
MDKGSKDNGSATSSKADNDNESESESDAVARLLKAKKEAAAKAAEQFASSGNAEKISDEERGDLFQNVRDEPLPSGAGVKRVEHLSIECRLCDGTAWATGKINPAQGNSSPSLEVECDACHQRFDAWRSEWVESGFLPK